MLKNIKFISVATVCIILFIITILHFLPIASRTIHIDEGMGIRASETVLKNNYHYSPHNGHGPTIFYLGAVARLWGGTNIVFFRLITAVCGILTIFFLWLYYRRKLNIAGQITLILGLGTSSAMVFFGNYFIQEMLFILLTAGALIIFELYLESRKSFWIVGFVILCALMYMTKETALFTFFAWIMSIIAVLFASQNFIATKIFLNIKNIIAFLSGVLISGGLYLLFFGKSFDLFISPFLWISERGITMHLKPWHYFLTLLFYHEPFLIIGSTLLFIYITYKKLWNERLLFFFIWFLIILSAYSVVPYKTPWLIPNIILPLAIFLSFGISNIWNKQNKKIIITLSIILVLASSLCLYSDNFIHPDRSEEYDYAYLQSSTGLKEFIGVLNGLYLSGLNKKTGAIIQFSGRYDELLYVITEKYNIDSGKLKGGLPIYINYWRDSDEVREIISTNEYNYVFLKFTYVVPLPEIDIFVRKDVWDEYEKNSYFIEPKERRTGWVMRYN